MWRNCACRGRDLSDVEQLVMRSGGKDVPAARQSNGWNPTFTLLSTEDIYKSVIHLYGVASELLTQAGTGRVSDLHSRIQVRLLEIIPLIFAVFVNTGAALVQRATPPCTRWEMI